MRGRWPGSSGRVGERQSSAYDWVCVELEEDDPDMPEVTHEEDILLDEGSFVRQIMIIVKLLPDYD